LSPKCANILGNRQPSPVIAVLAITGVTRPVKIFSPILPRDTDILFTLRARSFFDVVLSLRGTGARD
jgi:hypothetical protein